MEVAVAAPVLQPEAAAGDSGVQDEDEVKLQPKLPDEYLITIDRSSGAKLGIDTVKDCGAQADAGAVLLVVNIVGGLIGQWNQDYKNKAVREGDMILEVNGKGGDLQHMVDECRKHQLLEIKLQRQPALPADAPRVGVAFPLSRGGSQRLPHVNVEEEQEAPLSPGGGSAHAASSDGWGLEDPFFFDHTNGGEDLSSGQRQA